MTDEASRFADTLEVGGTTYTYYPVAGVPGSETLPYALTVLLENVLRNAESPEAAEELAGRIVAAGNAGEVGSEVEFSPARVLFQDFTGVPVFVDFAVMREACAELGGDPAKINPLRLPEMVAAELRQRAYRATGGGHLPSAEHRAVRARGHDVG